MLYWLEWHISAEDQYLPSIYSCDNGLWTMLYAPLFLKLFIVWDTENKNHFLGVYLANFLIKSSLVCCFSFFLAMQFCNSLWPLFLELLLIMSLSILSLFLSLKTLCFFFSLILLSFFGIVWYFHCCYSCQIHITIIVFIINFIIF